MKPEIQSQPQTATSEELIVTLPPMLRIPGGAFALGTSNEQIQKLLEGEDWVEEWSARDLFQVEQPPHTVLLNTFEIGKLPVTNGEYLLFVESEGYRIPRGWIGFSYLAGQENFPVVGVSWQDALAYCKWLSRKTGAEMRLPTEAEWERAARGDGEHIYPWGDAFDPWRCNTMESGKHAPTEVGAYSPGGDSPFGAADMVGNVWEMTSTLLKPYPYRKDDGREDLAAAGKRVLRGGSWYYSRKLARCAAREGCLPEYVSPAMGFRLARSLLR
jgi:toxoflavin biosynthesis protein ToxD